MLHSRIKRVEEQIAHELAQIITFNLADPRVQMASIAQVKVSRDLSEAVVLVSLLEDDPERASQSIAALESAKGYIKRLLAGRIHLKRLPDLHFKLDTTVQKAFEIYEILEKIKKEEPVANTSGDEPDSSSGAGATS